MRIKTYKTSGGKDLILKYIDDLPREEMLEGYSIIKRLKYDGLNGLLTRQIKGKVWEIKFYRHNRIFYVVVEKDFIYLLHACKKQKGKAEKFEVDTALKRAKEIL